MPVLTNTEKSGYDSFKAKEATYDALRTYPSADETKLAGIEAGATANQTGAEIKVAYEAEADTNAFTDAEKALVASALQSETSHADVLVDGDIGVTVQAYDADTAKTDVVQVFTAAQTIPLDYNAQTGTTYTAVLTDADKIISMNNASANTLTIPANTSVAYPVGTKLNIMQLGAGATTVAITTDTLNVNSNFTLVLNGQYAMATAVKVTSTTWVLTGNLVGA